MHDIFLEIKKMNLQQHLLVVTGALAFAFTLNVFIFSTQTGLKLQASALETMSKNTSSNPSDVFLQAYTGSDRVRVVISKEAVNVEQLEFSIFYNAQDLHVGDIFSSFGGEIQTISTLPGVMQVVVRFPTPITIPSQSSISIQASLKSAKPQAINMGSARIKTPSGHYDLTTSGVTLK